MRRTPTADSAQIAADEDGIVRVKSAYSMAETIARLKKDIAEKGIRFFDEVDQSKLATEPEGIGPVFVFAIDCNNPLSGNGER